jgi:HEPN domain-containing protein
MDNKVKYWLDLADYDLSTAEAMLQTKRYLYVGFMCHQIAEKSIKALYVKKNNSTPPYSHNLRYLLEETGIINETDRSFLNLIAELQPLNIETRYPTYKDNILKILTYEKCSQLINNTKRFLEWIKSKLSES